MSLDRFSWRALDVLCGALCKSCLCVCVHMQSTAGLQKTLSFVAFWLQLALSISSAAVLLFASGFTPRVSRVLCFTYCNPAFEGAQKNVLHSWSASLLTRVSASPQA